MDLYRELILDHYKNPRGHGRLDPADAAAVGQNPLCGDEVSLTLRLSRGKVAEARFEGRGCAISLAAASMLMEMVLEREVEEVRSLSRTELLEEMGVELSPVRLKCALLPLVTLRVALGGPVASGDIEARPLC